MEIIDELEPERRGSLRRRRRVTFRWGAQNLDTAIAIRSASSCPTASVVQAGAGIVADLGAGPRGIGSRASCAWWWPRTPTFQLVPRHADRPESTVVYDGIVYFSKVVVGTALRRSIALGETGRLTSSMESAVVAPIH